MRKEIMAAYETDELVNDANTRDQKFVQKEKL